MNEKITREKIKTLLSKPAQYEYFFRHLDKPGWFDFLLKLKIFDSIPGPQLTEDGQYIQFSPWWPGKYLVKISNKIPDKVFNLLKEIKTDNRLALDDCVQAILNMPNQFLIKNADEIIDLFDEWLDSKYIGLICYRAADLLKKYLDLGFFDGSIKLLDILSKTKKYKSGDLGFRFEIFYYQELVKKHLPTLIDNDPLGVLNIIEKNLKDAIQQDLKDNAIDDGSILWRPAIEDSNQNWRFGKPKDIFTEILRDTIAKTIKTQLQKTKEIIERYLNERFSIFRRLAIHSLRLTDFNDLIVNLLMQKENLDKSEIYHEFFKLVQEKFGILNTQQKEQFINWIIEGPPPDKIGSIKDFEVYKRYWQARRLMMLEKYLIDDNTLNKFRYLLDEYKKELTTTEHADFLIYHTSGFGPKSTLAKEEIAKMTPEQFIDWIKNNLQPPFDMMGPSPEGVSRLFQEVVKENPVPYASVSIKFVDEKIFPAYLCGFVRGLEEAIKGNKAFELEPIIRFIENPLKFHEEPKVQARHDEFDIGQYSWVRSTISNLIEALVSKDEIVISRDIMDRTQRVLIELVEKDEDPTVESEIQYGPDAQNMDYVTYCINSNRGKAMHALMQHALRRARMRPEEEKKKEEGEGPFPAGERMDLYKDFFAERLDKETSPSVQSSYGQFLPFLFYLDQEWVKEMKKNEKLFPKEQDKIQFWQAHWEGYVCFNDFFTQIYDLLKEEYEKAVDGLPNGKDDKKIRLHSEERLAEHLMIAYWRRLEEIENRRSVLNKFFKNAPYNIRSHAISFLANAIEEVKPKKDSEEWKRLKALWEDRINKAKDQELSNFVRWLKNCPEDLDNIVHLIKPIIPKLHLGYQEEDLLEYINEKIEINTSSALSLLNELFKIKESLVNIHFRLDLIKNILAKARKYKDTPGVANSINKAVNRLCEMGYYDFKNLLVQ